jgi:hypothetical protein
VTPPKKVNANPTEKLLCGACEHHLNISFERYGARFLVNKKNMIDCDTYIRFKKVNYSKLYLFFVSILWRASESSLPDYRGLNFGPRVNEMLRVCLLNNSLLINERTSLSLFFNVHLFRIKDKSGVFSEALMSRIMSGFKIESDPRYPEMIVVYFLADGFMINFLIDPQKRVPHAAGLNGQLRRRGRLKAPKVDISDLKTLSENFRYLSEIRGKFDPP